MSDRPLSHYTYDNARPADAVSNRCGRAFHDDQVRRQLLGEIYNGRVGFPSCDLPLNLRRSSLFRGQSLEALVREDGKSRSYPPRVRNLSTGLRNSEPQRSD